MSDPSPAAVVLRPSTAEDAPFFARVYAASRDYEMRAIDWPDEQKAAFLEQQFAAQSAHYADAYFDADTTVVMLGSEPVGRLIVHRGAREVRVVDIAILPEHRGRGIGTQLFETLFDEASSNAKPLSIHVEIYNPALRWYQRMGFRKAGETGPYLYMVRDGETADAR